jgi:methyl-accepting chemotaxis protein
VKPIAFLSDIIERRLKLRDWPLVVKFAAAPALMLALFLLAIALALGALVYTQNATSHIVGRDMRDIATLTAASAEFGQADGDLYRLLVDKANGNTVDVARRAGSIKYELVGVRGDLLRFAAGRRGGADADHVRGVVAQIDRYSDAVDVVSTMLDVDFSASAAMLTPFRANAKRVTHDIDAMAAAGVADADSHAAHAELGARIMLAVVVGAMILLAGLAVLVPLAIGRATVGSIAEIADVTSSIAARDHHIDLDGLARRDELGAIIVALKTFRQQAIDNEMLERDALDEERRRAAAVAMATAEGDKVRRDTIERLLFEFESKVAAMIDEAQSAMTRLDANTLQLDEAIGGADRLAGSLELVADAFATEMALAGGATDALTTAIRSIDREVEATSGIAAAILARATLAKHAVDESWEQAEQVEKVVDVIDDIARQTSLLALNATIEAARCGVEGRGFAVVAAEIQSLSGRTSGSTGDVRRQVSAVQAGVRQVVAATGDLSKLIDRMDEVTTRVAAVARDQARSTGTIDDRIDAVRSRVDVLADVSTSIRSAAIRNKSSVQGLRVVGHELQRNLSALSDDAQSFVLMLRAS